MSPGFQAQILPTDTDYDMQLSYVDPAVDQAEQQFDPFCGSPATTFRYRVVKRTFDLVAAVLIVPIVLSVGLVVSLLIVLDSRGGPVFFSHRRIMRDGKHFRMWKFRTMCLRGPEVLAQHFKLYPDDREEWKRNHKLRKDPRISRLGTFLRRTSLDELPQLWNVLTGEMSLVGPRPIVDEEVEKYGSDFVYYTSIKPGITGLWQTSGRSTLTYPQRVALDRFYVENWSLRLELKILIRTVRSLASCDGAY